MDRESLKSFLKSPSCFPHFQDREIEALIPCVHEKMVPRGEWLIREGEAGQSLFILTKGKAEITKQEGKDGATYSLGFLEPGQWVGEMAGIQNAPRSASIQTLETSNVIEFDVARLKDHEALYDKTIVHLSKIISERLRRTNQALVTALVENMENFRLQNIISKIIIQILLLSAIWFNLGAIFLLFPNHYEILQGYFAEVLIIIYGFVALFITMRSGYPLSTFGLTTHKALLYLIEGATYSLPIIALMTLIKWALVTYVDPFHQLSIFSFGREYGVRELTSREIDYIFVLYAISVPFQEFIVRGCIQNCFRIFFTGPYRVFNSIFASNLIYGTLHTVKSIWLTVASFILGCYWGLLMERQRSLAGVTISHLFVGFWVLYVLDFYSIFYLFESTLNSPPSP